MARLPIPGGDVDAWAAILNEYLLVTHNADGTQKTDSIGSAAIQSRCLGIRHLRTTNPTGTPLANLVLSNNGSDLTWRTADEMVRLTTKLDVNVMDFGALGDGVHDDTAAIQAAIDSVSAGGGVIFPRGIFMVRGLKIKKHGTTLIGTARQGTRIVRLSGTQPLIDLSGTGTMFNHIKYCSIASIMLSGNNMPGTLLRSYYADNCIYREVNFVHCAGTATDLIEAWDTPFEDCAWEDCGSDTEPAILLRNTMLPGVFGYSEDNTNQIHFHNCRWEGFRNGAVRLDGAANGSSSLLNGIFFVSCKMETRYAAGPAFQIMEGASIVFVSQMYIAIMSHDPGYSDPIDVIEDRGTHVFMTDIYVQWGPGTGLANSVIHIYRGSPHTYHKISSYFPTEEPRTASLIAEPEASMVMITSLWSNRGQKIIGDTTSMIVGGPSFGYIFPIDNIGTFRITSLLSKTDIIKVDNNLLRPAFEVVNGTDTVGYSDNYVTEKWRIIGDTGAARFAGGKFQIEPTKGYVGINTVPYTGLAMQIRIASENDKGLAIVRPTATATKRLLEFQDESYNLHGMAFDFNGRPIGVGTPARVTAGEQVAYANPGTQVWDMAGSVTAPVKPSPTAPGVIATITFSRPYTAIPSSITLTDNSVISAELYVSDRSVNGFTVSTRNALASGSILNFDYLVVG